MIHYLYAIEFWVSVMILIWFFYGPWQNLIIDITRDKLFSIRDEVFLYAIDGKLDINSIEYIKFRELMNNFIRYIHKVNVWGYLAIVICEKLGKKPEGEYLSNLMSIIHATNDEGIKEELALLVKDAYDVITISIIFRSIGFIIYSIIYLWNKFSRNVNSNLEKNLAKLLNFDSKFEALSNSNKKYA